MPSSDIIVALMEVIRHEQQAYDHANDRWIKASQESHEANVEMANAERRTLGACQALIAFASHIDDQAIRVRCKDVGAMRGA